MALKFEREFEESDIERFVNERFQRLNDICFEQLEIIGEQFVRDARQVDTYKDHTGNLRASIGYGIGFNGELRQSNLEGPWSGAEKADLKIKKLVAEVPKGFVLVVVAGMFYAGYVEARGFDVLTGSSLTADTAFKKAMERIQQSMKAKK